MNVIQAILGSLYRIWFYIWVGVVILILLPALTISISRKSWYPFFFKLARIWARMILYGMGLFPQLKFDKRLDKKANYILVANHTSMTDIMLMLHVSSVPFVFVGKKELAAIPVFGYFYKRTCILVDRNNARSKHSVYQASKERLQAGLSVCIFPEGGIPENAVDVVDHFKDGAFRMAIEHQIPIIPMTFFDNKKRLPDTFYIGGPGRLRVRVHEAVLTDGLTHADRLTLRDQVRATILRDLKADRK